MRALSEAEALSFQAQGLSNPICVIPNGVDLPDLSESNAGSGSHNRKTLLYLGRLHRKKNVASLIRAWNHTFNSETCKSDTWILAIAGWDQSGYESELKRIAAVPSIVFLGPQFGSDKSKCYRTCDAFIAYHFDAGTIRGVDVSGLSMVTVNHIPGNVLTPASWKVVLFVDSRATDAQHQAIVDAYSGKLGGPLADLAGLIGEVLDVRRETISHEIRGGTGALQIGDFVSAEMAPFAGPDGTPTTLRDTIFSTVPGSPAYAAKASRHTVNLPQYGMVWSFEGRNAIQSDYRITHTEAA